MQAQKFDNYTLYFTLYTLYFNCIAICLILRKARFKDIFDCNFTALFMCIRVQILSPRPNKQLVIDTMAGCFIYEGNHRVDKVIAYVVFYYHKKLYIIKERFKLFSIKKGLNMIGVRKTLILFLRSGFPPLLTIVTELVIVLVLSVITVHLFKKYDSTNKSLSLKKFYMTTTIKSWLWAVLTQFCMLLFTIIMCYMFPDNFENLPPDAEWQPFIPFVIIFCILSSIILSYLLNYFLVYRKKIGLRKIRIWSSLLMSFPIAPLAFISGYLIYPSIVSLVI